MNYYQKPVEALTITEYTVDRVKRLENIKLDNILFECYLIDNDEMHLIANPYPDLFIEYQIYYYGIRNDNNEITVEMANHLKGVEIILE